MRAVIIISVFYLNFSGDFLKPFLGELKSIIWNYFFRYDDQWITTYSLLRHRICNVPEDSGLWNHDGLSFDPGDNKINLIVFAY